MKIIAGIDIGNATTETAIGKITDQGQVEFLSSALAPTSGMKGTDKNIAGIHKSLQYALDKAGLDIKDLSQIRINEAAPVIGDVAMETITETVITESTMIGHNPTTPGGLGIGTGLSIDLKDLDQADKGKDYIVLIEKSWDFVLASREINRLKSQGFNIKGAILQKDDGVLVSNRLDFVIPILDEVTYFEKIPRGVLTAIEVAPVGKVVEVLSNPYGIATLFQLDSEETKSIVPISRALIGNRSAVVLKTPAGDVNAHAIPAGTIHFIGREGKSSVDVDLGADEIMKKEASVGEILDIKGEAGTNAGAMLERVRSTMASLTQKRYEDISIQDLLAVDTLSPQKIQGGLAGESAMESAVGVAAMVRSDRLQMSLIANKLEESLNIPVVVGGVEADMAIRGALTTPGSAIPLAILDLGAGSSDASIMDTNREIKRVHLAGAGNMVSLLIQTELGLGSFDEAEKVKIYPLAKVESMFHLRHEDGSVEFFEDMIDPHLFGRVVLVTPEGLEAVTTKYPIERIKQIRQEAKSKVFVTNAIRALETIAPLGNVRSLEHVVLVGGSALDFEIPQLITDSLAEYGVVAGRGNIRGTEGPRNAVATGLLLGGQE